MRFLEECFTNLPKTKQGAVCKTIRKAGQPQEVEGKLRELVTHECLRRLGYIPEFQPRIDAENKSLTPDFAITLGEQPFIMDVYTVYQHTPTIDYSTETGTGGHDGGERAEKIVREFENKISQYKALSMPLVLFVYLGDQFLFTHETVEEALFGMWVQEIYSEDKFPGDCMQAKDEPLKPIRAGGMLLPNRCEDGVVIPNHPELSATVFCNLIWRNHKRLLCCYVLHHWQPKITLPLEIFQPFRQLYWVAENDRWVPRYTKETFMAVEFIGTHQLIIHDVKCSW
jgi:hypothetical protein